MVNLIPGTHVIISHNKLKHLNGRRGVVIDAPDKKSKGYWGIYLRARGDLPDGELWFPESEIEIEKEVAHSSPA